MPTMIKMMPIMPAGFIGLKCASAAEEVDDQDYNREHEQNMNESAQGVRTDQTKQPEHQQYDKYCPKHNGFLQLNLPLVRGREDNCAYRIQEFWGARTAS